MITITARVIVIVGSAVGDFHQRTPSYDMENGRPNTFATAINIRNVIPRTWNRPPVCQSKLLLMMPFTKSIIHSMKFCIPVGFIFKFLVDIKAIKKTMSVVTANIRILDQFPVIPRNSNVGFACSTINSPLFHILIADFLHET